MACAEQVRKILRVHRALGLLAATLSRQSAWVILADDVVYVTEFRQFTLNRVVQHWQARYFDNAAFDRVHEAEID